METLRKEGLSLNEDLEKRVSDLEENIIKKEILPDSQVEHKEIGKTRSKGEIAPATRLKKTCR